MPRAEIASNPCPPKTRADLEWDRVLAATAARCAGPLGRELATSLAFAPTRDEVRTALAESREATQFVADGELLPVAETADVREAISRLRAGGTLGSVELREIAQMLGTARVVRRFLATRRARCPMLYAACSTDPTLDNLADMLADCFEPDGSLADRASPRLRELRGEYHAARQRLIGRLTDLMHRYDKVLQDHFVTEREGRYVLPVRSDAHERFPGIVHSTSSSGATLFIEPRAVIPMGNRLKVLEAEVQREEIAVYTRLSAELSDALPSIEAAVHALARADVRAAIARLAHDLGLTFPEVVDEPRLDLRAARHPLLALDLPSVVPSDVALASGRAMVVSGPNAGGKTVVLKTMGLAALMVRAGLPVACAEGSVVGLFDIVLTDVGDDQNLQKNLSTFSAHVSNLVAVLEETHEGSLVLLDELAGGTDPREGEALAAGVLDSLCARGGAVAVATHYEGLKALALGDERFENASVGFDLATMTPTFRLVRGVPGRSSALAVAQKYGMPSTVIERATRFLSREDQSFESLVRRLNDERAALDLARQAAEQREQEAARARTRLDAELNVLKERERQFLSREGEALVARVQRAREDLRAAQAKLRARHADEAQVREAARAIERIGGDLAVGGELEPLVVRTDAVPRERVEPSELRKGAKVYVSKLRAEAEVLELLQGGGVRVAAGPLKLVVPAGELLRIPVMGEPPRRAPARREAAASAADDLATPIQTTDNTCDLRGLRADDAVALATSFLDRSLNSGQRVVFLVHGHGTGALRDAIRSELKQTGYVTRFRPGGHGDGGDGVTVAWIS